MNTEWERLDPPTRQIVEAVIAEATRTGRMVTRDFGTGDVYAYPHRDGMAWGVNGGPKGFNLARGIVKRETEDLK